MKKSLLTIGSLCALIALTVVSGFVHGRLTNRWGVPVDLKLAAQRFEKLPKEFGEWRLEKEEKMSDTIVATLECEGYINGSYVNRSTGETVNAFVILGPPGPISVHTPEVCYSSKNYDIAETRSQVKIGSEENPNTFWAMTLRSSNVTSDLLRVYYAWGNDKVWTAPESPRMTFGGDPLLFKIQLAANLPPDADLEKEDTCRRFLEEFVPLINPILLTPPQTN